MISFPLLFNTRQKQPQHKHHHQERQNHRLQHRRPRALHQQPRHKRQHRRAAPAKRRREANHHDVEVPGQQLARDDDGAGEHGSEEESLERDGDGRHDELRHEPKDEFQNGGADNVNLHLLEKSVVFWRGEIELTETANLIPILGLTNPRSARPMVMPSQKPAADMPLEKSL